MKRNVRLCRGVVYDHATGYLYVHPRELAGDACFGQYVSGLSHLQLASLILQLARSCFPSQTFQACVVDTELSNHVDRDNKAIDASKCWE